MRSAPSRPFEALTIQHAGAAVLLGVEWLRVRIQRLSATLLHARRGRTRLRLSKGAIVSFRSAPGAIVRCRQGSVWLTDGHEGTDHILRQDEEWRFRGGREPVVVQALDTAELDLRTA